LGQLFCPQGLAVFYPHPGLDLPFGKVVVAAVVVAGISAASLAGWRRRPHLIVGWLWYVGMLIPVIGLTQTWKQAMADRFTYLPQIGLCIALFWAAADLFHSRPIRRWAWGVTSAMVLAVLMGCAWRQTSFWRDSEILWNHTLACTSRNDVAHHNLAAALAESGRLEEALTHYRKVLEIQPDDVEVAGHIGVILTHLGRLDEALAHYRKLLERKPASAQAHYDFGAALTRLGRCDEALVHYRKALEIRPTHALAHYEMGRLLVGRGKSDEALAHYRMALELQPTHALTHYELGQLLAGRNQCDEALAHYRMALELSPNNAVVHCSLGDLLAGRGQSEEALVHYQQSLKIEPDCAMTRYKLGNFLADRGQYEQASAHYQQALKLQPDCAMAHCKLAWLRATCPSTALRNGAEAIEHAVQAKLLCKGEQTEVLDALAAAYAEAGWFPDALTTAHRALELATRQNNPAFADTLRTRIALYEARRPFHQVQSPSELPQPKP
jgi:tetratricopeptide (TPR) repeat protein